MTSPPAGRPRTAARATPVRRAAGAGGRRGVGRAPVHPGYFLDTRYLKPLGITQQALASAIGISRRRVNELTRGRRGITADTALRLAHYFRNDPAFWLQLQVAWDLYHAERKFKPRAATAPTA